MDKEKFLASGLLELYVLGLTSPEESKEVERIAENFPEIKKTIDESRAALESYATQYSTPPPSGLKSQILTAIDEEELAEAAKADEAIHRSLRQRLRRTQMIAAAAAIGFLIFSTSSFIFSQKSNALAIELNEQKIEVIKCQEELSSQLENEKFYAAIRSGETKLIYLEGTPSYIDSEAVVYLNDKAKSAQLDIINLPPPPKGKQYQIWADVNGEMVNAGLLALQSVPLQDVIHHENAESYNITLEPEGGSDHPTVEFLYASGKV